MGALQVKVRFNFMRLLWFARKHHVRWVVIDKWSDFHRVPSRFAREKMLKELFGQFGQFQTVVLDKFGHALGGLFQRQTGNFDGCLS